MHELHHGVVEPRGYRLVTKDRQAEARFGLMFRHLPAFCPPVDLLVMLAASMEQPRPDPFDQFDNPDIPAGFTFFGQFVDHDLTLDLTSDLEKQQDPDAVRNFRTPLYDLDSVYKDGPEASPQLYDGPRLRLSTHDGIEDLPRGPDGLAQIGDARNDENAIVCQLQIAFIKFHNAVVDHVVHLGTPPDQVFAKARRLTQWHYQWVVLTDFLPRIVGGELVERVLDRPRHGPIRAHLKFYKPKALPYMPVEFSVAAYRFGHSQVRPAYRINAATIAGLFESQPGERNMNGFRPLLPALKVDWPNFFDVPGSTVVPQRSMRIDTRVSAPLLQLPFGGPPHSLPERNLLRGRALGLPAGQAVAKAMGVTPLANSELGIPDDPGWQGKAPLWFYVLKEAELQRDSRRLGDVGGRIVAEVLVGLLAKNRDSFFHRKPDFRPEPPLAPARGVFTMGDLLRVAGAA